MEKQLNTILKGAGAIFIGMIFSKIFSYVWRLILARTGAESYGMFTLGIAVIEVGIMVSFLAPPISIERFASYYYSKDEKSKSLGAIKGATLLAIGASAIIAIIIFIYAEFISSRFFHETELSPVLKVMAIALPFVIGSRMLVAAMKALQNVKYAVFGRDIVDGALKIILIGLAVYFGYGLIGATIGFTVSTILSFFVLGYFLLKLIRSKLGRDLAPIYNYKELLLFSLPLLLNEMSLATIKWTDSLFIGYFRNVSEVGIYNAAAPTASLMINVPLALSTLFLPVITAEYARNNLGMIKTVYATVSKWIVIALLPLLAGILLFAKPILTILFGPEFGIGWITLMILAFRYFVVGITFMSTYIPIILKKTTFMFITTTVGAIAGITFNFLLIPRYGHIGAAVSTLVSVIIVGIMYGLFAYKTIYLKPFSKSTFALTITSLAFIGLLIYFANVFDVKIIYRIVIFFVSSIFYVLTIYKFGIIGKEEFEVTKRILKKLGITKIK